mmetsp:Transcript_73755/g.159639  ORF Transcript_73755/g.159639 Transcript_73755/m.159639 type:complete len:100 (-) Transcript_73755:388-687(-)
MLSSLGTAQPACSGQEIAASARDSADAVRGEAASGDCRQLPRTTKGSSSLAAGDVPAPVARPHLHVIQRQLAGRKQLCESPKEARVSVLEHFAAKAVIF